MVTGQRQGHWARFISIYLPPDSRTTVLAALAACQLPNDDVPTVVGGDLNFQTLQPREGEATLAADWLALLDRLSSIPVAIDGPTRVRHGVESSIDAVGCSAHLQYRYEVRKTWKPRLSDHAVLFVDPADATRQRLTDVLTPAVLKGFPREATDDLRRRYASLGAAFRLGPPVPTNGSPSTWTRPAADGSLPESHPTARALQEPARPTHYAAGPATPSLGPVPFNPLLLLHGREALHSAILDWGRYWTRRRRCQGLGDLLVRGARSLDALAPEGLLQSWLLVRGWDGRPLSRRDCLTWLGRWRYEACQRRAAALHPTTRGPGASRPALAAQYRRGREMYKGYKTISGVEGPGGVWTTRPASMDRVLFGSRANIWTTAPPGPPCGRHLLSCYTLRRGRLRADLPARPDWDRLIALVLAPAGSPPGIDGIPYEAYYVGAWFVACLLGQGVHAAEHCDDLLAHVLGPSTDLLVWIPKIPDPRVPNDLRPLQLPTCLRRHFGAYLADVLGPHIEARLCCDQAAHKGGHCGPNITAAMRHLETPAGPDPGPGLEWDVLLGDDLAVVNDYISCAVASLPPAPSSAVFFADQNKAFERIALQWLRLTLHGWGLPQWLVNALLALVEERSVQYRRGNYKGPVRRLLRSVGMGGTASPLLWCIGYDPIIAGTASVAGAPCPTYVDDLASLLRAAAQTLRVAIFLPWASWAAGLEVATHHCRGLHFAQPPDRLRAHCASLPVRAHCSQDGMRVTGLPPDLLRRLLARRIGVNAAGAGVAFSRNCHCSLKSALVPASDLDWWRDLMDFPPSGGPQLRISGRTSALSALLGTAKHRGWWPSILPSSTPFERAPGARPLPSLAPGPVHYPSCTAPLAEERKSGPLMSLPWRLTLLM